ncbi:MAG: hypothetical protein L0215_02885 [Gemmataceae bacterium]|nr:hypothetical protein [Gemmataceae bacterium]
MKEYRDLTISGPGDVLIATVAEIEKELNDGWQRNKQIEEKGRPRAGLTPDQLRFCFTCAPTTSRKGALLVLMNNRADNLWLTNIVPDELGKLTPDEFNYILEEFLQKFVRPAAAKTGATIATSNGVVSIDDWFAKETADKLRRFLDLSHGGTSHPDDHKRWMEFLVSAQNEGAEVRGDLLRRWLIEDAGCDEYVAEELASEYQTIRDYERSKKEDFVGA